MKNICATCGKQYEKPPSRIGKYCSKKCSITKKEDYVAEEYQKKMPRRKDGKPFYSKNKIKNVLENGFFNKQKEKYKDLVIDYLDSPTGKAYVGINKAPFMKNDNGIGFKGVLLQDDNRMFIQCSACGKWLRKITDSHLLQCSGITTSEYKEKFELNKTCGLVSDETSLTCTRSALKNKTRNNNFTTKKDVKNEPYKQKIQNMNQFETCPLQLKNRLKEFIRCNRELPTQRNRGRSIYKALVRRYGSWGHALVENGLPYFKRTGTNMLYTFPDGSTYKFNINQFYDREELYYLIENKCLKKVL